MSQPLLVNDANASQRMAKVKLDEESEANAGKNDNFVQFRRDAFKPFRGLVRRSGVSAQVLLCLVADMSFSNSIAYSVEALEEETGASRSAIFDALARLERERWIDKVTDTAGTFYRVNSRAFWASSKNYLGGSFSGALEVPDEDKPVKSKRRTNKVVIARVVAKKAKSRSRSGTGRDKDAIDLPPSPQLRAGDTPCPPSYKPNQR